MRFFLATAAVVALTVIPPQRDAIKPGVLSAAIQKSLPLLQSSDATFIQKSQCVSCHHNSLTAVTVAAAREAGIRVNEDIARQQVQAVAAYAESWRERLLHGVS